MKYLISDNEKYYNISNQELTEIGISSLSADAFTQYGNDTAPDGTLLLQLEKPKILCWQDGTGLPAFSVTVKAIPSAQTVITKKIDLSHYSVTGVENVAVECSGSILFACSFDSGGTWKMFNGTTWAILSDSHTGMSMETLQAITTEQWGMEVNGIDSFLFRFTLSSVDDSLTNIVVNYTN